MVVGISLADPVAVLTLRGPTPSKKNAWKRGKGRVYIPNEHRLALEALEVQARIQWASRSPMRHPVLVIQHFVRERRQDIDNRDTAILDVLCKAGVLENDNIASLNNWRIVAPAQKSEEEYVVVGVFDRASTITQGVPIGPWPKRKRPGVTKRKRPGAASKPRASERAGETTTVRRLPVSDGRNDRSSRVEPAKGDYTPGQKAE